MRVEWLFFRWLVIIGAIVAGLIYISPRDGGARAARYQTVPLVQGERVIGLPLAGIMVNPKRREVLAVVSQNAQDASPEDFFVLWKDKDGQTYGADFPSENGAVALCAVNAEGKLRVLASLPQIAPESGGPKGPCQVNEAKLRAILEALPGAANGGAPGADKASP